MVTFAVVVGVTPTPMELNAGRSSLGAFRKNTEPATATATTVPARSIIRVRSRPLAGSGSGAGAAALW